MSNSWAPARSISSRTMASILRMTFKAKRKIIVDAAADLPDEAGADQ